jgi:hypothetical protein
MTVGQARLAVIPPHAARATLALVLLVAVLMAVAVAASSTHAASAGDPALALVLRAMAVIKAGMAAGLIAGLFWRLGVGVGPLALGAYAVAAAAMAAGPVLIWGMTHLVLGAVLLHGGLLACALMLWRDPATTRRLKALVAARRLAIARTLREAGAAKTRA